MEKEFDRDAYDQGVRDAIHERQRIRQLYFEEGKERGKLIGFLMGGIFTIICLAILPIALEVIGNLLGG